MRRLFAFFPRLLAKLFSRSEIVGQIGIDIESGLTRLTFRLWRERKSNRYYATLGWERSEPGFSLTLETDDLDRLIITGDQIRAAQSVAFSGGPPEVPLLGRTIDMILRGEVLRRTEIKLNDGSRLSFHLKRQTNPPHEYIAIGVFLGISACNLAFELDEFHRFVAAAKKTRANMPDAYRRSDRSRIEAP